METPPLEISNLTKRYGKLTAVSGLSLQVGKGEVFGILGPNGSGKTTTINCILDLVRPTSGEIRLFGSGDLDMGRKRIGVVPEHKGLYRYFSAWKNMQIECMVKGVDFAEIDPLLTEVNLLERKKEKVSRFSFGMQQRLLVAMALLGSPEMVILDEPTNGLDPKGIIFIRDLVKKLAAQGTTILLASHLLHEMEQVCTSVAILNKGEQMFQGKLAELTHEGSLEDAFLKLTV